MNMKSSQRDYHTIPALPDTLWTNPLHFVAFGFGTGAMPFAPGTWGTLIAIPFYLMLQGLSEVSYAIATLIITLISIFICSKATKDIGIEDHQGMCLDEIVGFFVTMLYVPFGWGWILAGFLLFRLFDIWKPWPICFIDRHIHGGFGIILDDVIAGLMACLCLHLFRIFF